MGSFPCVVFRCLFLLQSFLPSSQHPSDLVQMFGEGEVMVVSNNMRLPCNGEEELYQIELGDGTTQREDFLEGRLVGREVDIGKLV